MPTDKQRSAAKAERVGAVIFAVLAVLTLVRVVFTEDMSWWSRWFNVGVLLLQVVFAALLWVKSRRVLRDSDPPAT